MYYYVYRITFIEDKDNKKYYYGARASKLPPQLDLGEKYFSSSSLVKELISTRGKENFKFKVVSVHPSRQEALIKEIKLHAYFNVESHDKFLNRKNQRSALFTQSTLDKTCMYKGTRNYFIHKSKVDVYVKLGYTVGVNPITLKNKKRFYGEHNPVYGKKHSERTKEIISDCRSKLIKVTFCDGNILEFKNRTLLGSYLGMSVALGCALVRYKNRSSKLLRYNIKHIEVDNENN